VFENEPMSPGPDDLLVPVNLGGLPERWRWYRMAYDQESRTVAWSTRRGTQIFAVPGSPASGALPTLASLVVVSSIMSSPGREFPIKLFVLVDDEGAPLDRFPPVPPELFDRAWPGENLVVVEFWGVELQEVRTGDLPEVDAWLADKYTAVARRAIFIALGAALLMMVTIFTVIVLARSQP
jgi:hypothetical protein